MKNSYNIYKVLIRILNKLDFKIVKKRNKSIVFYTIFKCNFFDSVVYKENSLYTISNKLICLPSKNSIVSISRLNCLKIKNIIVNFYKIYYGRNNIISYNTILDHCWFLFI